MTDDQSSAAAAVGQKRPYLVVKRRRDEWSIEQYKTLDEAAAHREILLACGLDEVFLAKRFRTRVVEVEDDRGGIGGAELREKIIDWLGENPGVHHYSEIFDGLRAAGVVVRGVNPTATLLTTLTRCTGVEPIGGRTGCYRLREVIGASHAQ